MKSTGRYSPVIEFDIDQEINLECDKAIENIKEIKSRVGKSDAKVIFKNIIETYLGAL